MMNSRFTDSQIMDVLRRVEAGLSAADMVGRKTSLSRLQPRSRGFRFAKPGFKDCWWQSPKGLMGSVLVVIL
jgi:hypothetical protein